jgi:hypothetical protein
MDQTLIDLGIFLVGAASGAALSYLKDRRLLHLYGDLVRELSGVLQEQVEHMSGDAEARARLAEIFNLLNRASRRMDISDDGFSNTAARFVLGDVTAGAKQYPASFRASQGFLSPTSAYAPRQVQFGVRVSF